MIAFTIAAQGKIGVYNYSNGAYMKSLDAHTSEVTYLMYCDEARGSPYYLVYLTSEAVVQYSAWLRTRS